MIQITLKWTELLVTMIDLLLLGLPLEVPKIPFSENIFKAPKQFCYNIYVNCEMLKTMTVL